MRLPEYARLTLQEFKRPSNALPLSLLVTLLVLLLIITQVKAGLNAIPEKLPTNHDAVANSTLVATWLTYKATVIGIGVASVAALFALYDIYRNTAQVAQFYRRPNRQPVFWSDITDTSLTTVHGRLNKRHCILGIKIKNDGERLTRQFLLELYVPLSVMPKDVIVPKDDQRQVNGHTCMLRQFEFGLLYPNDVPTEAVRAGFDVDERVPGFTLFWRIFDDNGNYPAVGYGQYRVVRKTDTSPG